MDYSVITIGYKSLNNIVARVNDAYNSTITPKEFIVVINNYSNDITSKIVDYVIKEPRITRWALISQNMGCAKALNLGFDLCHEEYMVALNDDCSVGNQTFELLVKGFDSPKIGITGVEAGHTFGDKYVAAKGFLLAFRKSMIDDIGGYDTTISPLACEREMCLKAQHKGWELKIVPGCQWFHIHDISNNPHTVINYLGKQLTPNNLLPVVYPRIQRKIDSYNV